MKTNISNFLSIICNPSFSQKTNLLTKLTKTCKPKQLAKTYKFI